MLKVIIIGLRHLRTVKKCAEFVPVSIFIELLTSNKDYVIPAQVTREIINEGIPSTFESLHGGAALALKDINPSEVLEFTNFSGLPTASAERHAADESRKLLEDLTTVPDHAPVALVAYDNQGNISGGRDWDLEQNIDATCPSPAVSASQETPAVDGIIDPAAFEVAPISQMPQDVCNAIRTIRVVLGEAIAETILTPSDGFSSVAELTAVMDVKNCSNMSLDLVLCLFS